MRIHRKIIVMYSGTSQYQILNKVQIDAVIKEHRCAYELINFEASKF